MVTMNLLGSSQTPLSPKTGISSGQSTSAQQTITSTLKTVFECAVKLEIKPTTLATAATCFHKFNKIAPFHVKEKVDSMLIGAACIYLASKVEEEPKKLRDIINVFNATINPSTKQKPLQFDDNYWTLRESLVDCELVLLKVIKFEVEIVHPHKYLLYYLRSLTEWIGRDHQTNCLLAQTCYSILNDFYIDPRSINYQPNHLAIAVIQIALEMHNITIPYSDEAFCSWPGVFCSDLSKEMLDEIKSAIFNTYERDEISLNRIASMDTPSRSSSGESSFSRKYTPSKIIDYESK